MGGLPRLPWCYRGQLPHLCATFERRKAKMQAQVNLVKKLTGSKWGAEFSTLRISTLALDFTQQNMLPHLV